MEIKLTFQNNQNHTIKPTPLPYNVPSKVPYNVTYVQPNYVPSNTNTFNNVPNFNINNNTNTFNNVPNNNTFNNIPNNTFNNVPNNTIVNNRTIIPNPRLAPNMFVSPRQQTIPTVSNFQLGQSMNMQQPVRRTCCGGSVVH